MALDYGLFARVLVAIPKYWDKVYSRYRRWRWGRSRSLDPVARLALREKWKAQVTQRVRETNTGAHRQDICVRDINRLEAYSNDLDDPGYFRAGLIGDYGDGAKLGLGWEGVVGDTDGTWRFFDHKRENRERGGFVVGFVLWEDDPTSDCDGVYV